MRKVTPASALLAFLAGCSGTNVVLDTSAGVTPIYSPAPAMSGGLAAPPPGLAPQMPPPAQFGDRSGTYAGTAVPLMTGGGLCLENQPVSGFRVSGNSVRFGNYRGRIAPDGGLQMVSGNTWIVGQFEGPTFRGQVDMRRGFGNPFCTYMLTLDRVGP